MNKFLLQVKCHDGSCHQTTYLLSAIKNCV